ncbi:MAG: shikimate kinase [Thermodesulfovibrionales bacterium]|nr:shikimate kinase [Thermodesulfovibrionales bacterium]
MKNIVIIGFMGTGKTTVGKMLAQRLGFSFLDIDTEIEKTQNMTIKDIFANFGEERFREIETQTIRMIKDKSHLVIATGGGVVTKSENMNMLKENGIIVCLTASAESIFQRVRHKQDRPLLLTENPLETIKELLKKRQDLYKKADIHIDTTNLNPMEVVSAILDGLDKGRG